MTDPNAERQQQLVQLARVGGVVLTVVGLVLAVTGFVSFASSMGSASDGVPSSMFVFLGGGLCLVAGTAALRVGFFGAATRFAAREATPALRQLRDDVWPAPAPRSGSFCGSCGAPRGAADRFCPACGTALPA